MPSSVKLLGVRTGSSTFWARDWYSGAKRGGTLSLGSRAGTQRYWPVIGGWRFLSREWRARTAAMFPPAEAPPTMRPREGEAWRVGAWEMAQVRASQQSFMPVGNLCSGARLGPFCQWIGW